MKYKRRDQLRKYHLQSVYRRYTLSRSQSTQVCLQPHRRAKPDKTAIQARHRNQRIKESHVSVGRPTACGNILYQFPIIRHCGNRLFHIFRMYICHCFQCILSIQIAFQKTLHNTLSKSVFPHLQIRRFCSIKNSRDFLILKLLKFLLY